MSFIVEMTKSLAWPVAIAILLLTYRTTIKSLLTSLNAFVGRLHSMKYGDLQLTAHVLEQAVKASDAAADAATEQIVSRTLDPKEKAALLARIKHATAEAAHLRSVLANVAEKRSPTTGILHLPEVVEFVLGILAEAIGIEKILRLNQSGQREEIQRAAGAVVNSVRMAQRKIESFDMLSIQALEHAGLLGLSGPATDYGARELVRIAKEKAVAQALSV